MDNSGPKAFIFMKVGYSTGETIDHILERKQREFDDAGKIFWGYGGSTVRPRTQAQPFAEEWVLKQGSIRVLMALTESKFNSKLPPAKQYSKDEECWKPLPKGICVTGSGFALVLDEITQLDMELNLRQFEVGKGPSKGTNATDYLVGQTSKACLVKAGSTDGRPAVPILIAYQARLKPPYAVFLR